MWRFPRKIPINSSSLIAGATSAGGVTFSQLRVLKMPDGLLRKSSLKASSRKLAASHAVPAYPTGRSCWPSLNRIQARYRVVPE